MSKSTSEEIAGRMISKDNRVKADICSLPDSILKKDQIDKLVSQYFIIEKAKQPYLIMASNADTVLYSSTNAFLICSIAFGILAFLIAKQGWDNVKDFYLRSSFLILFFASSYFGFIPKVFNQKEIGKFNLSKYFEYEKLQTQDYNSIRSYNQLLTTGKISKLDSTFSDINSKMISLYEFTFEIYNDKVSFDFKLDQKNF